MYTLIWRRRGRKSIYAAGLTKILGGQQKYWGQGVAITDETISVSQFLGERARAAPKVKSMLHCFILRHCSYCNAYITAPNWRLPPQILHLYKTFQRASCSTIDWQKKLL